MLQRNHSDKATEACDDENGAHEVCSRARHVFMYNAPWTPVEGLGQIKEDVPSKGAYQLAGDEGPPGAAWPRGEMCNLP